MVVASMYGSRAVGAYGRLGRVKAMVFLLKDFAGFSGVFMFNLWDGRQVDQGAKSRIRRAGLECKTTKGKSHETDRHGHAAGAAAGRGRRRRGDQKGQGPIARPLAGG